MAHVVGVGDVGLGVVAAVRQHVPPVVVPHSGRTAIAYTHNNISVLNIALSLNIASVARSDPDSHLCVTSSSITNFPCIVEKIK